MLPQQLSSFNNQIPLRYPIKTITAKTYDVSGADLGQVLSFTGTVAATAYVPSPAIVGAGFNFYIWNQKSNSVSVQLIVPSGITIDFVSPYNLRGNEGLQLISDGINWNTSNKKPMRLYAESTNQSTSRPIATGDGAIAIGYASTASAINSYALGAFVTANQTYSYALGSSATTGTIAKVTFGSLVLGNSGVWGTLPLGTSTTSATPTVLTSDGSGPSTTNQMMVPVNGAVAFLIYVVARQQAAGGTASAAWKIEGLARQEATAATTTIVASTTTVISNVPGWAISVGADTTNGAVALTVTGGATTNIRWLATAYTSEINYA